MVSVNEAELDAEKLAERDALLKDIEDAEQRIQVCQPNGFCLSVFQNISCKLKQWLQER